MRRSMILNAVGRRTPAIVATTLCAALVAYWAELPEWLPYGLAIVVGSLALIVMGARDRRAPIPIEEEPGSTANESWLAREIAGNGSPGGSYLLGFFCLVTIVLTGLQGAYALPAWAALALTAAWGIANARYRTG